MLGILALAPYLMTGLQAMAIGYAAWNMGQWSSDNVYQTGIISGDRQKILDYQYSDLGYKKDLLDFQKDELMYYQSKNYYDQGYQFQQDMIQNAYYQDQLKLQQQEFQFDISDQLYWQQQHDIDYYRQQKDMQQYQAWNVKESNINYLRQLEMQKLYLQQSLLFDERDFQQDLIKSGIYEGFDMRERKFQSNMQTSQQAFQTEMFNTREKQRLADANQYQMDSLMQTNIDSEIESLFGRSESMAQVAWILTELYKIVPPKPIENFTYGLPVNPPYPEQTLIL